MKYYVNKYGDAVDNSASVLSNENVDIMEQLLREQGVALEDEKKFNSQMNKIITDTKGPKVGFGAPLPNNGKKLRF